LLSTSWAFITVVLNVCASVFFALLICQPCIAGHCLDTGPRKLFGNMTFAVVEVFFGGKVYACLA
jgi:hypothetical protein